MSRVKRSVHAKKRKRALFKSAKGYRGGRSKLLRTAKDAVDRSREYAYRDRKVRKRDFRKLWISRINAAVRVYGLNYSKFINSLSLSKIDLDRRMLAHLAVEDPQVFSILISKIKSS